MRPPKHILCPVDFSEWSTAAMHYAAGVAKAFNADLTLLHVFEMPAYAVPPPGNTSMANASVEESLKQLTAQLKHRLDDAKLGLDTGGRPVKSMLHDGLAYPTIVEMAEDLAVDLIVMGTQGRTGVQRLLLGSVAERVVRSAPCPVLTVPRPKS